MQLKSRASIWHYQVPGSWWLIMILLFVAGFYAAAQVLR